LNRNRGKLYENVFGAQLISNHLKSTQPERQYTILIDRVVFQIELPNGCIAKRRADVYIPETRTMVEIKSGRIGLTKHIKKQIYKDMILLKNKEIDSCFWFLFYGATSGVIKRLENGLIDYFDFEFGFTDDTSNNENITIIRV